MNALFLLRVIVNDLDLIRPAVGPDETEAILIIDANTMLSGSISAQCLESIGWRRPQIAEGGSSVHPLELAASHRPQERRTNAARSLGIDPVKNVLRTSATKRSP